MGQQLKQGPGLREEIFRAVQLDRELTQNNQMLVLTDSMNACLNQATQLAEIGLVTSIAPANHNTGTSEDERDLKTSEEVCQRRNRKLARYQSLLYCLLIQHRFFHALFRALITKGMVANYKCTTII